MAIPWRAIYQRANSRMVSSLTQSSASNAQSRYGDAAPRAALLPAWAGSIALAVTLLAPSPAVGPDVDHAVATEASIASNQRGAACNWRDPFGSLPATDADAACTWLDPAGTGLPPEPTNAETAGREEADDTASDARAGATRPAITPDGLTGESRGGAGASSAGTKGWDPAELPTETSQTPDWLDWRDSTSEPAAPTLLTFYPFAPLSHGAAAVPAGDVAPTSLPVQLNVADPRSVTPSRSAGPLSWGPSSSDSAPTSRSWGQQPSGNPASAPEPSTLAVLSAALAGLCLIARTAGRANKARLQLAIRMAHADDAAGLS